MVFLLRLDQTKEAVTAKNVPPSLAILIAMAVRRCIITSIAL
jgi:hypothetical protein